MPSQVASTGACARRTGSSWSACSAMPSSGAPSAPVPHARWRRPRRRSRSCHRSSRRPESGSSAASDGSIRSTSRFSPSGRRSSPPLATTRRPSGARVSWCGSVPPVGHSSSLRSVRRSRTPILPSVVRASYSAVNRRVPSADAITWPEKRRPCPSSSSDARATGRPRASKRHSQGAGPERHREPAAVGLGEQPVRTRGHRLGRRDPHGARGPVDLDRAHVLDAVGREAAQRGGESQRRRVGVGRGGGARGRGGLGGPRGTPAGAPAGAAPAPNAGPSVAPASSASGLVDPPVLSVVSRRSLRTGS